MPLDAQLAALPPGDQVATRLRLIERLPTPDIAALLGWTEAEALASWNRVRAVALRHQQATAVNYSHGPLQ